MSCEDCLQHSAIVNDIKVLKEQVDELKEVLKEQVAELKEGEAELKTKQTIMSENQVESKVKLDQVIQTLNGIVVDVKALATLPAKRWDNLISSFINTAVGIGIGALVTFLIKR